MSYYILRVLPGKSVQKLAPEQHISFYPSMSAPLDTRDVPVVPMQEYPSPVVQQLQQHQGSRNSQSQSVTVCPQEQPNAIPASGHVAQPPALVVPQVLIAGMEPANQTAHGMVDLGIPQTEIQARSQLQQTYQVPQPQTMMQMGETQAQMQARSQVTAAVAGVPAKIDINDLGSVALPDLLNQINPQLMGDFSSRSPEIMNFLIQQRIQAAAVPDPTPQISSGSIIQIPGHMPDSSLKRAIFAQEIASPGAPNVSGPQEMSTPQGVVSPQDMPAPMPLITQFQGQIEIPTQPAAHMTENFAYLNNVVGNLPADSLDMHARGAMQGEFPTGNGHSIMASLPEAAAGVATRTASYPLSQLPATNNAGSAMERPHVGNKTTGTPGNVLEFHQSEFAAKEEPHTMPRAIGGSNEFNGVLYNLEVQGSKSAGIDGLPEELNVCDDKTEEKRKLRAERNRQSAAASRERKKHHIKELERRISMLSKENAQLQVGQLEVFKRRLKVEKNLLQENATLKKKLVMQDMTIQSLTGKLDDMRMSDGKKPTLKRPNTWSGEQWGKGRFMR